MVAPGFRSRIATGLVVAAVVLPVPLGATSAVASDRQATPVDRPPNLVQPGDTPDDYAPDDLAPEMLTPDDFAVDDRLSELPTGAGQTAADGGFPGRPGRFRDLPDRFSDLPYGPGRMAHRPFHRHHGWEGRWHHHPHHPFGRDFSGPGPSYYGRYPDYPGDGDLGLARPADPRGADRAHPRHASAPKHQPSASASPDTWRPSSRRVDAVDRGPRTPYEALPPLPTPTMPEQPSPDTGTADGASDARPYALEAPAAPVERVLPMGAGLALTGLGLAFLGLRLRRR
ncbi:hypothetical protein OHA45_19430 [Streptomyces lydicus]|uniref:hypothetical protein n=1 Tax=Streptomyces lydicus TaxID=47763 RepID=UPI002E2F0D0B|nr:hypothetical protein [Streptomyces lydicus]